MAGAPPGKRNREILKHVALLIQRPLDARDYERFGIDDNSPLAMWRPTLIPSANPTQYPEGKRTLPIDAFEVEKKWILDR